MVRRSFLPAFVCLTLLILILGSCANAAAGKDANEENSYYAVYKNFDEFDADVRAADSLPDGEPIVGVLLKYTSEGAYNTDVYPRDMDSFSIYCLFDAHGFNGDDMEFNYVLYVPEDIQNKFIEGGGTNPDSGDPFWWYMKTYMNSSMTVIQGDWASTIRILCDDAECPQADSADVAGWNN